MRVLDHRREPVVDMPVALEIRMGGLGTDRRGWTPSRGPDGLARIDLREPEELRQRIERMGMRAEVAVIAGMAATSPARVALPGWPSDGDEVEMVLPATGSVVVRVVDGQDEGVPGAATVAWWWLPADVAERSPNTGYDRVQSHVLKAEGGVARIDGVGLGLALQVQATVPGRVHASVRGWPGPTEPGEVRELVLAVGDPLGEGAGKPENERGRRPPAEWRGRPRGVLARAGAPYLAT